MTIVEQPTLNLVSVDILRPADGTFVLAHSLLGGTDVLGNGASDVWEPVLGSAVQNVNVTRGVSRDGIDTTAQVGTLSFTVLDSLDPDTTWWLKPNLPVRVVIPATSPAFVPLFIGTITDVSSDTELVDDVARVFTSITAQDGVGQMANITRYGASTDDGTLWESFASRVTRLQTSAPGQTWHIFGTSGLNPGSYTYADLWNGSTGGGATDAAEAAKWTCSDAAHGLPFANGFGTEAAGYTGTTSAVYTRQLTGLTPGRLYWLRFTIYGTAGQDSPGVNGTLDGRPVTWSTGIPPGAQTYYETPFVASGASVPMTFTLTAGSPNASFERIELATYAVEPYVMSNTVFESSLASHFDLLCSSVPHGGWWVGADGRIAVVGDLSLWDPTPNASFSDVTGASGTLHYVGLTRTYDSAAIVNDLTVNNHARQLDADSGSYVAADTSYGYTDATSQASYGAVGADIDTSLASSVAIGNLSAAILAANGTPASKISEIRWNVQEDGGKSALMRVDIYSMVSVTYNAATTNLRVLNITHEISPTRWMITYGLGAI